MGSDCAAEIHKWKNWEQFLDLIPVAIYPRPEYEIESKKLNIIKEKANQIDLKQNYEFATFKPPCNNLYTRSNESYFIKPYQKDQKERKCIKDLIIFYCG